MSTKKIASSTVANHSIEIWESDQNGFAFFIAPRLSPPYDGPTIEMSSGYSPTHNPGVLLLVATTEVRSRYPEAEDPIMDQMPSGNLEMVIDRLVDGVKTLERYSEKTAPTSNEDCYMVAKFATETYYTRSQDFEMYLKPLGFRAKWLR